MTQVNRDNVLAVRNAIKQQADDLQRTLQMTTAEIRVGKCGGDPISADAVPMFMHKIGEVLAIHWNHLQEVREAVDRLTDTARRYGYTEGQIQESFKSAL